MGMVVVMWWGWHGGGCMVVEWWGWLGGGMVVGWWWYSGWVVIW
jgi:hypothetical protein